MTRKQRFGYQISEDVAKEGLVFGRVLDNKEQLQIQNMRYECMDIVAAKDAKNIEIKNKAAKVSDLEEALSEAEEELIDAKDEITNLKKDLQEVNNKIQLQDKDLSDLK